MTLVQVAKGGEATVIRSVSRRLLLLPLDMASRPEAEPNLAVFRELRGHGNPIGGAFPHARISLNCPKEQAGAATL